MKKKLRAGCWLIASLMAASAVSAQTNSGNDTFGITLGEGTVPPLNRFGLSYRSGWNISAKFKNSGGFSQLNDPGPATSGADHRYDDGYNRVDRFNNDHGPGAENTTWFWGYQNASQVPGDGFIYMHSVSSSQESSSKEKDGDPQHGVELTYNRQLGRVGRAFWGVEGAFNFTDVTIRDQSAGGRNVTTDRYDLGGIIPPEPPLNNTSGHGPGSFEGPGPLISALLVRTISSASTTGDRNIEASLYGLRLGPYVELPLTEKLGLSFSGGLAIGIVDSEFSFRETVVSPSTGATVVRSGSDSEDDVLVGAYIGANFLYAITEAWDVSVGAQYQYLDGYSHRVSDKKASVDLGKSVFLTVGFGYSF